MLYRLGPEGWEDIKDLKSSQEEADTCILLHASRASKQGHKSVIIVFEDTYVLILCLAFNKEMASPLYVKCAVLNWTVDKIPGHYQACQLLEMVFVRPLLDSMHSQGVTL